MTATKKIKIVFCLNDFIIGGVQRLYIELFKHFDSRMYDIHLVTLSQLKDCVDMYDAIPAYVTVHRLDIRGFRDLRSFLVLARTLREIRPQVVVTSLFFSNTLVRLAGLFGPYPIIAVEQNTNTWKSWVQALVDHLLAYRSKVIVAASASVRDFAVHQARIPIKKFRIIHNSVDLAAFRSIEQDKSRVLVQREFNFPDDVRIAVTVARLVSQKNHPMLINAFKEFVKTHPSFRLVLIGEGQDRQILEECVRTDGMEEIIILAGARKNVLPYYAAADFFALPSFVEGFGIAHAEALASGIPVLSTKTAGPDEMIEEGKNGYFVEPNIESIRDGLERMADEGVSFTREEIQESVSRFDSADISEKYEQLIREILQKQ